MIGNAVMNVPKFEVLSINTFLYGRKFDFRFSKFGISLLSVKKIKNNADAKKNNMVRQNFDVFYFSQKSIKFGVL